MPAALPRHQQPPQQRRQRTRLSGGHGLHCSPRRRRRAALRARPRAAWSHAPPAPRALEPAPAAAPPGFAPGPPGPATGPGEPGFLSSPPGKKPRDGCLPLGVVVPRNRS
ncbi:unnamed protein product [Rangifer tarandus platyrhynchus]|uniref:Uncharacterized protein n=2 Tax=Rangifer tarandus platyrhynchus TaxID=3082113 RepID=A0ABN8ZGV1_RANTA|nr:unnamed protein product [Rangifer tarandus platyrhynchus]CAI9707255.1 unnamed protein product [Rangifer tarandus platyrhynchus]